jgi:hypothetical protein
MRISAFRSMAMALKRIPVFISSKQIELHDDRMAIAEVVAQIETLEPVYAEEWAPRRAAAGDVYRTDALRCPLYIGLFWRAYSAATEEEYRLAVSNRETELLLYVRDCPELEREDRLLSLIAEFRDKHVFRRYDSTVELRRLVPNHLLEAVIRMVTRLHHLGQTSRSGLPMHFTPQELLAAWGLDGTPAEAADALSQARRLLHAMATRMHAKSFPTEGRP